GGGDEARARDAAGDLDDDAGRGEPGALDEDRAVVAAGAARGDEGRGQRRRHGRGGDDAPGGAAVDDLPPPAAQADPPARGAGSGGRARFALDIDPARDEDIVDGDGDAGASGRERPAPEHLDALVALEPPAVAVADEALAGVADALAVPGEAERGLVAGEVGGAERKMGGGGVDLLGRGDDVALGRASRERKQQGGAHAADRRRPHGG